MDILAGEGATTRLCRAEVSSSAKGRADTEMHRAGSFASSSGRQQERKESRNREGKVDTETSQVDKNGRPNVIWERMELRDETVDRNVQEFSIV